MWTKLQLMENLELIVTETAAQKARAFMEERGAEGYGLRVAVQACGCAGLRYQFFLDTRRDDDYCVEEHGVSVLVDPQSAQYLRGATIDYIEEWQGSGFSVVNPSIQVDCGCGHSFF